MPDGFHLGRVMLPGNSDLGDVIPVQEPNRAPVSFVLKNPPKLLDTTPTIPPTDPTERKETDPRNFPKLRGFA